MHDELKSGISYYWFCCDPIGQLAVFHSGSFARIPEVFSQDIPAYERDIRVFANDLLDQLPFISGFDVGPHPQHLDHLHNAGNLMQEDAKRGIYVYDVAEHLRQSEYYCAYRPHKPLLMDDLFESERAFLKGFAVEFLFANTPTLKSNEIVQLFK